MTKSGLIEAVANRTPHISKKDTEIVVNTIFDAMAQALKTGERTEIRGFGSFQVKIREAREGRNPKTGEPVHISAKRTPFFKVGKELKEMVDDVRSDGDDRRISPGKTPPHHQRSDEEPEPQQPTRNPHSLHDSGLAFRPTLGSPPMGRPEVRRRPSP